MDSDENQFDILGSLSRFSGRVKTDNGIFVIKKNNYGQMQILDVPQKSQFAPKTSPLLLMQPHLQSQDVVNRLKALDEKDYAQSQKVHRSYGHSGGMFQEDEAEEEFPE
jgi:hypothetical protein